ncbi:MAG: hypothetical protein JO101_07750 [Candidatus Eremiobacteraeota bacterium]|nr:hypothetical protein [Candidatus Eremiobacteraeota bacterium]MBV8355196.1 hypothetical protein [Candidatus Eremiobacteraeota bacterium]
MLPVAAARPRVHRTLVVDRRQPHPLVAVLGLAAPDLASDVRPGQFVMAICPQGVQPATALAIYEAAGPRVSLMIIRCGPRTDELAALAVDATLDVMGPLGNGFFLDTLPRHVGIVAGGVGIASVLKAAQHCTERGVRTTLYYGARTAAALVDAALFAELGCEVKVATEDGTRGHCGYVTDLLLAGERPQLLLGCGPSAMLRALSALANEKNIPAQLSLEEAFACGVGACWGCVVPLERGSAQAPRFPPPSADEPRPFAHARVCTEGPVFWAHELRW